MTPRSGEAVCSSCGRRWAGKLECHCRLCHRHFTSVWAFDKHQPSYSGCLDPATVMHPKSGEPLFRLDVSKTYGELWAQNRVYRGPGADATISETAGPVSEAAP